MTIENILSFVYVYRYGSFHKAANALYVTQPSLSSRIRTLEKELDTPLLTRDKAPITLTEDGEKFLPYALQIISLYTQAQKALTHGEEKIVIGTHISISVTIFPYVFRIFHQRNPGVSIEIITGMPEDLPGRLFSGECDFLVSQDFSHPDVEQITVYRDRFALIAPPGHAFTDSGRRRRFAEVGLEPLIRISTLAPYWDAVEAQFKSFGATPNVVLSVDSLEIARNMVMQGIGLAFVPRLALETELLSRSLVAVETDPPLELEREIKLSYLTDKEPLYLDQFVELFRRYDS